MATKPTKPKILSVKRTDDYVQIAHEAMKTTEHKTTPDKNKPGETKTKEVSSAEVIDLTAHDAPLPAFDKALQSLGPVAALALGCPSSYADNVEVESFSLSYTENGVRSVVIHIIKPLLQGTASHKLKTPTIQIEDDKQTGERRQCTPNHAERVIDAIKEAQRYVAGDRSQQVLGFEEDEEDDDKIEQLPGMKQDDPANDGP